MPPKKQQQSLTNFFSINSVKTSTNKNLPPPKVETQKKTKKSEKSEMEIEDEQPNKSRSVTPSKKKLVKPPKKDPKAQSSKNIKQPIHFSPKKSKSPVGSVSPPKIINKTQKITKKPIQQEKVKQNTVNKMEVELDNKLNLDEKSQNSMASSPPPDKKKLNRLKKVSDKNVSKKIDKAAKPPKKQIKEESESEEYESSESDSEQFDSEELKKYEKGKGKNQRFKMEDDNKQTNIKELVSKQQQKNPQQLKKDAQKMKQEGLNALLKKKKKQQNSDSDQSSSSESKSESESEYDAKEDVKQLKEDKKLNKMELEEENSDDNKIINVDNNNKKQSEIQKEKQKQSEIQKQKQREQEELDLALALSKSTMEIEQQKIYDSVKKQNQNTSSKPSALQPQQKTQALKPQPLKPKVLKPATSKLIEGFPEITFLKQIAKKDEKRQLEAPKSDKFKDYTFVFTGVLPNISREVGQKIVQSNGGKVTSAVSGKTTYLVTGDKLEDGRDFTEGSKYKKATALKESGKSKIKILNETEFGELLKNKTGYELSQYAQIDDVSSVLNNLGISTDAPKSENQAQKIKGPPSNKKIENPKLQAENQKLELKQNQSTKLWTTYHAPNSLTETVGNQDKIKKMIEWLTSWEEVVIKKTKKHDKPVYKNWGQGFYPTVSDPNKPACFISGPPGIGKTTTVRLLAQQLGYEIVEQNASDVRNKKGVKGILGHLTNNTTLGFDKSYDMDCKSKTIILMDEVDGMSSGDRGGNQELIQWIDKTKIPIFCICNDAESTKVRSLKSHCYVLEFSRPKPTEIIKRVQDIITQEKLNIDEKTLLELIESLNCDIRQVLNCLQTWAKSNKSMSGNQFYKTKHLFSKDMEVALTGFNAAKKLMNQQSLQQLKNFHEKIGVFMIDYDQIPLIVQNQYLEARKKKDKYHISELEEMADVSATIAQGDIIDQRVRKNQQWSLLPNMGFHTAIYPCEIWCESVPMIKFPAFFGKLSSKNKVYREIRELRQAVGECITGSRFSVKFDYARPLLRLLLHYLEKGDIEQTMQILENYNLEPKQMNEMLLDCQYPSPKTTNYMKNVETKTKTALTKAWKNRHDLVLKGQKKTAPKKANTGETYGKIRGELQDDDDEYQSEDDGIEEEEDDDMQESSQIVSKADKNKKETKPKQTKQTKKPKK